VVISHEPWGEASISWSGCGPIVSRATRFITADVALTEAGCAYDESSSVPVLFVMKRDGPDWKLAAARVLTPR
jgi:hypothetical protein